MRISNFGFCDLPNENFHISELGVCAIQLLSIADKKYNIEHTVSELRKAYETYKPRVIALPECFNAPYDVDLFESFAEVIPSGETCQALSRCAKELNIYIVGGSIIERDDQDPKVLYNTSTVWSPTGELIAKHQKVRNHSKSKKNYI